MKDKRFSGVALGLVAAATLTLGATPSAAGQDAALVKKGQELYTAQKCQMCHAIDGQGNKMFALDGVGKKLSAEEIRNWITDPAAMHAKQTEKPKMKMRSYGKLPKEDVDALVAYMQSLK
jgi:mono/diheme cytochrome c family protein